MPAATTENVAVWPAVTVWLAGWVVIEGGVDTPRPVSVIVTGELDALLNTDILPDALPVAVGAKLAETVALCPAISESGRGAGGLMLKPVPVTEACETIMAAVPEFVRVRLRLLVEPSCTSPKSRLRGLTVRTAEVGGLALGELPRAAPTHPD